MTAICEAAGIEPITPHVFRHRAATWAVIHGADLIELRDASGWRSLAMPNKYVKVAETVARRGAERVAGAINIFAKPKAKLVVVKSTAGNGDGDNSMDIEDVRLAMQEACQQHLEGTRSFPLDARSSCARCI